MWLRTAATTSARPVASTLSGNPIHLLDRQPVASQAHQLPRLRSRGGEADAVGPGHRRPLVVQLLLARPLGHEPRDLLARRRHRLRQVGGGHRERRRPWTVEQRSAEEAGDHAVRQALTVAQAHAEARRERGLAEHCVAERGGEEVIVAAPQTARMPEQHVEVRLVRDRLHGLIRDHIACAAPRHLGDRGAARVAPPQQTVEALDHLSGLEVADQRQHQRCGPVQPPVHPGQVVAGGLLQPRAPLGERAPVVRVPGRIRETCERPERTVERVFLRLGQLPEAQRPQLVELLRRKRRLLQHLGQQLEDERKMVGQTARPAEHLDWIEAVPRHVELDAAVLGDARQLEAPVPGGPALEHLRDERRHGPLGRLDQRMAGEQGAVQVDGGVRAARQQQQAAAARQLGLDDPGRDLAPPVARSGRERGRGRPRPGRRAAAVLRDEVPDRHAIVDERRRRNPLHVVARDRLDPAGVVEVEAPVRRRDRLRESGRHLRRRVAVERRLRLHLRPGAQDLALPESFRDHLRQLGADDPLDLRVPGGRVEGGEDLEQAGIAQLPSEGLHVEAEAGLHQPLVQPRRYSAAEGVGQHRERVRVGVRGLGHAPRHHDPPDFARPAHDEAALPFLTRLARHHRRRRPARPRQRPEVAGDERQRLGAVERAHQHQRRVVRVVEGVVERPQALDRGRLDVAPPPDRRMVVRVLAERDRERLLEQHVERVVLAALELVADDGHLRGEVRLAQQRAAHAVGLELEREREVLRRQRLVVIGAVEPRGGVEGGADALEDASDRPPLSGVERPRPLEHQVLEQVGGPGMTNGLVAGAHVVDDARRHHGHAPVRQQKDPQPVRLEAKLLDAALLHHHREGIMHARLSEPLSYPP